MRKVSSAIQEHSERQADAPSQLGTCEILNIENEGESHDIVENKGWNFLSHDVHDK
jgi:hypothetical protein